MKKEPFCETHKELYSLYCETCKKPLCLLCPPHTGHQIMSLFTVISSEQVASKMKEVSNVLASIDASLALIGSSTREAVKLKTQTEAMLAEKEKVMVLEAKEVSESRLHSVQYQFIDKFKVLSQIAQKNQKIKADMIKVQHILEKVKERVDLDCKKDIGLAYKTVVEFKELNLVETIQKYQESIEELAKLVKAENEKSIRLPKYDKESFYQLANEVNILKEQKAAIQTEIADKKAELETLTESIRVAKGEAKRILSENKADMGAIALHLSIAKGELEKVCTKNKTKMDTIKERMAILKEQSMEVTKTIGTEKEEQIKLFAKLKDANKDERVKLIEKIEASLKAAEGSTKEISERVTKRCNEVKEIAKSTEEFQEKANLEVMKSEFEEDKRGLSTMIEAVQQKIASSQKEILETKEEQDGLIKVLVQSESEFKDFIKVKKIELEKIKEDKCGDKNVKLKCGHSISAQDVIEQRKSRADKDTKGVVCSLCSGEKGKLIDIGKIKHALHKFRSHCTEVWVQHEL
eukprot:TRINITY_DN841_c0_g1_i8.p1 TRINITY_DN841_c0_g1~~TRINITY_DN841_c0_g1_i8.p1  ORF type:complete len:591 (-),score=96.88 TRINITY_DN841_c0_g1_i8:389-1951(-)